MLSEVRQVVAAPCIKFLCVLLGLILVTSDAFAQRQMERLGRGVVAVRTGNNSAYVGWRLLATDPEDVAFNVYRSQNGAAPVKINAAPLTNSTDFIDASAVLSVSNAWFIQPVLEGIEQPASAPFGVAGNSIVPLDFQNKLGPYIRIPLAPIPNGNHYTHHCWPGDLDGDGEFDFVATRVPNAVAVSYVDAYLRDGTFLWRMNMGANSTDTGDFPAAGVSVGHSDNVTVFDMDGDGLAEVLVRTARGVTVTNAAGVQVAAVTGPNDTTQYLSVVDGKTGIEKARMVIPNPVPAAGPMSSHFGIMFADGRRPSVVIESINRNANGWFNLSVTCWDYRDGQLKMRWLWTPPNDGHNYSRAHQIRIVDIDHDGRDEFCEIAFALRDAGDHAETVFSNELLHGDRFHITDLDPDRPGLETYAVQQDNPNLLATALYESGNGGMIKKWYASGVVDVGRGNASDVDLTARGVEVYSTMPGLWSARGTLVNNTPPYPNFGVWWDADLAREQLDNGRIDKYGVGRILSPYNMRGPALDGAVTWRNAQPLYGDLFGDWREEVMFESTDRSSLIIFTPVSPATNRLVCLAQNPAYRACLTVKGYMQSTWPDFYIGAGMGRPPVQPVSDAELIWNSDSPTAVWDFSAANWLTNNLWVSNAGAVSYFEGASVVFGMSSVDHTTISLAETLAPRFVKVHSPGAYTFVGGGFSGGMTLTKAGAGRFTLNGNHTFTGATLISEGLLALNGELPASAVTVRSGAWLDGRVGGNGRIGAGVTVEQGGGVSPGQGTHSPGTLTISNALTLTGFTLNDFDLSNDPTGTLKSNDLVRVFGNVVLQGTNTLVVHRLDPTVTPGVYSLIRYSGALQGSLLNLRIAGLDGVPHALTNGPGEIALIIKDSRPPATVVWTGGPGGIWDLVTSSNWLNGGNRDWFVPHDSVRFDNTGAANPIVSLVGAMPVSGVTVDSTLNYTLTGKGSMSGAGSLIKTNTGTLALLTENDYTGQTIIGAGTVEVPALSVGGAPGPLGSAGTSPNNLVIYNGTLRVTGGEAYTDRGITLAGGASRLDVPNGGLVNVAGQIVGPGTLDKRGGGTLIVSAANSYSGGTLISAGTLQLGSPTANSSGLGQGLVTLSNGGVLSLFGAGAEDLGSGGAGGSSSNPIFIPAGSTGSLQLPFRYVVNNTLSGAGTLNLGVTGVRGDLNGNWAAFSGTVNIGTIRQTSDARFGNAAGLPNARVYIAAATALQNRVGGNPIIPVGELSGANGSIINAPGGNGGLPVTWRVGGLNTDATFAGNAYNNVGFIKEGGGTWVLTGTNVNTGSLTINAGTVQVGNGGTRGALGTGAIINHGTLAFNRSDLVSDAGFSAVGGSGHMVKLGSGRLELSRTHSYTGVTRVQAGQLALTGGTLPNSSRMELSGGALFDVSGAPGGSMILGAGKTICGNGTVRGNFTVGAGATLEPGLSIGTLSFSNTLALAPGSRTVIQFSTMPPSHDVVQVSGTLNLGGTLVVTNIGPGVPVVGQHYQMFHADAFSGEFASVVLPSLPLTLSWNTSELNTAGRLSVIAVTPPMFAAPRQLADGTFRLQFSGTLGLAYEIRVSTNLSLLPLTNWTLLATGVFGEDVVVFDDVGATNSRERFYLIRVP